MFCTITILLCDMMSLRSLCLTVVCHDVPSLTVLNCHDVPPLIVLNCPVSWCPSPYCVQLSCSMVPLPSLCLTVMCNGALPSLFLTVLWHGIPPLIVFNSRMS